MTISQRTQRVVVLSTSLPCCAFAAWGYCDERQPRLWRNCAYWRQEHEWIMKPYCPKHARMNPSASAGRAHPVRHGGRLIMRKGAAGCPCWTSAGWP